MSDLLSNLRAGWRLAALRFVGADAFRVSLDQAVLLFGINLALAVGSDWLRVEPPARFDPQALSLTALHFLVFVLAAWLVSRIGRRPDAALRLVVMSQSTGPVFTVLYTLLTLGDLRADHDWFNHALWGVYYWAILVDLRAVFLAAGAGWWRSLAGCGVLLALTVLPQNLIPRPDFFWHYEPRDTRPQVDAEAVFYDQPRLLDTAAQSLLPSRPGVTDLYFVGFAGWGGQDVFMREVGYARGLFDERFGTAGRSIALINNPGTVGGTPIASVTNLRRVLKAVGERMDPAEDVLFLFLTSHGERGGRVSVDFWPLSLNTLTGDRLREMLDESGIRFRVIVVSSCYSGGLLKSLANDDTLVITAARPDRTSFGCSNEADFTYFGRAFFVEQLAKGQPFTAAFEAAKASVLAREREEGYEASEPQMALGKGMEAMLARIGAAPAGGEARGGLIECGAKEAAAVVPCTRP